MQVLKLVVVAVMCTGVIAPRAWAQPAESVEVSTGFGGTGMLREQTWGLARSTLTHEGLDPVAPLLTMHAGERSNVQFGQRVWLPAKSRRLVFTPIYPLHVAPEARGLPVQVQLIADDGPRARLLDRAEALLPVQPEPFRPGVISDGDDDVQRDLLVKLLGMTGRKPSTAGIRPDSAPTLAAAWGNLDSVTVSRHTPDLDAAQREALRQWLIAGGRLWIMLDQVDPDWPRQLLGDNWRVAILDRVPLTHLTIVHDNQRHEQSFDYPVTFLRVAAPGMQVIHTVDGFPASLRQSVGAGELLVTTLAAPAWLAHEEHDTPLSELTWFAREPRVGAGPAAGDAPLAAAFDDLVREQIGYTIMSWRPVVAVLGLFVVVLVGGGLWLARQDRLEWIAVAGVAGAVVASGALIGYGLLRQRQQPLTVAAGQLVRTVAHQPYAEVTGRVGIYTPPAEGLDRLTLTGTDGGTAWLDDIDRRGDTVRVLWRDVATWQIPDLALPSGAVQHLEAHRVARLDEPIRASVRFTDEGLAGTLAGGPITAWQDGLIATRLGHIAAQVDADGTLQARAADRLPEGQFIHGTLMSQAQQRRQQAYRRLFADGEARSTLLAEPALLAWGEGIGSGITLSAPAAEPSESLLVVPLSIEPPAPGQRVTVPAIFLEMAVFRGENGYRSTIYDPQAHTWIAPIERPERFLMRFELPESLRDLRLDRATVSVNLRAPGWRVGALTWHGPGQVRQSGDAVDSPLGRTDIELVGDEVPPVIDGAVVIGLRIEPIGPTTNTDWTLRQFEVSVSGAAAPARDPLPDSGTPP